MCDMIECFEVFEVGMVKLVGIDYDKIIFEVFMFLDDIEYYEVMSKVVNFYGDGLVCERIIEKLIKIE